MPSKETEIARSIVGPALGFFFPTEIIHQSQGSVEKAKKLLREGYGLIVIYNHFSLDDPLRVLSVLHSLKLTEGKSIIHPLAMHQSRNFPGLTFTSNALGVNLSPIITKNTVKAEKATHDLKKSSRGSGHRQFRERAIELLGNGGIVVVSSQGERQEKLDYENIKRRTMKKLFMDLDKQNIEKIAIMIIGVDIKGTNSYSKKEVGGINFGREGVARIGEILTLEEIKKEIENTYPGQKYWDVFDNWTAEKLIKVVSSRYARK